DLLPQPGALGLPALLGLLARALPLFLAGGEGVALADQARGPAQAGVPLALELLGVAAPALQLGAQAGALLLGLFAGRLLLLQPLPALRLGAGLPLAQPLRHRAGLALVLLFTPPAGFFERRRRPGQGALQGLRLGAEFVRRAGPLRTDGGEFLLGGLGPAAGGLLARLQLSPDAGGLLPAGAQLVLQAGHAVGAAAELLALGPGPVQLLAPGPRP